VKNANDEDADASEDKERAHGERSPGWTNRGQAERERAENDADSLYSYQRSMIFIFFVS
jgi:hypothetical protein